MSDDAAQKFLAMQSQYYESQTPPEEIVGFYNWHEEFPYETQLLYRNGDLRHPLVNPTADKVALDFGCGPGRMVLRMSKLFARVDGVDISQKLIEEARRRCPGSQFYKSAGDDIGQAPRESYDFVYSTIAMQHIPVRDIRRRLLAGLSQCLRPGGVMCLQLAFNRNYPLLGRGRHFSLGGYRFSVSVARTHHADWRENRYDAKGTNSSCDATISLESLPVAVADFSEHLTDVAYWFYDVSLIYENLNGQRHSSHYWPTHWIFISGRRPA